MGGFTGRSGDWMRFRLPYSLLGVAAWLLAAPAGYAFTIENKDAGGQYAVPKFDLDEQARNFRKDGSGATGNGTGLYETPLGNGKLQFGIQQGSSTNFGSVFAPGLGPDNSRASRQHMDRMLSAPSSLDFDGSR